MTSYIIEGGNRRYFVNPTVLKEALINHNPAVLNGSEDDWTAFSSIGNIVNSSTLENDFNMIMKLFPETDNIITIEEIVTMVENLIFSAEGDGYLDKAEEYIGSLINMEITHFLTIVYIMKTRVISIDDLESLLGSSQKSRNIKLLKILDNEIEEADISLLKVVSSMENILSSVIRVDRPGSIDSNLGEILPLRIREFGTPLAKETFKGFVRSMVEHLDNEVFERIQNIASSLDPLYYSGAYYTPGTFSKQRIDNYRKIRNGPVRLDGSRDYGRRGELHMVGMKYNMKSDPYSTSNFINSRRVDGYVNDYLDGVMFNYSLDQMRLNRQIDHNNRMGGLMGEKRVEEVLSTGRKLLINKVLDNQTELKLDFSIEKAIRLLYENPINVKELSLDELKTYAEEQSEGLEKFTGDNVKGDFSKYALTPYLKSITLYGENKNPGSVLIGIVNSILQGFGLSSEIGSNEDKIIEKTLFPKDSVYFGPTRIPRMKYESDIAELEALVNQASRLAVLKAASNSDFLNSQEQFENKWNFTHSDFLNSQEQFEESQRQFEEANAIIFDDINEFIGAHKKYSTITERISGVPIKSINLNEFVVENLGFQLVYRNTSPGTAHYIVSSVSANIMKRDNLFNKIEFMVRNSSLSNSDLESSAVNKEELLSFGRVGNPDHSDPINIRKFLKDIRNSIVCYAYDGSLETPKYFTGKTLMQRQMEFFIIKFLSISFLDYVLDNSKSYLDSPFQNINRTISFNLNSDNPVFTKTNGVFYARYNGEIRAYEVVNFVKNFFSNFDIVREMIENDEILNTTRYFLRSVGSMNLSDLVELVLSGEVPDLDEVIPERAVMRL